MGCPTLEEKHLLKKASWFRNDENEKMINDFGKKL